MGAIRRARRDGTSQCWQIRLPIRALSGNDRPPCSRACGTTSRALDQPDGVRLPSSGRSRLIIDRIRLDDEDAPPKQRQDRRRSGVPADPRRAWVRRRLCTQVQRISTQASTPPRGGVHPLGHLPGQRLCRALGGRPHPHRFPRQPSLGAVPGHGLGLLERPVRPGATLRAQKRSSKAWSRPSSSSGPYPGKSGGTTAPDRRHADPDGARRQLQPRCRGVREDLFYVFEPRFACQPARRQEARHRGPVKAVRSGSPPRCHASPTSTS